MGLFLHESLQWSMKVIGLWVYRGFHEAQLPSAHLRVASGISRLCLTVAHRFFIGSGQAIAWCQVQCSNTMVDNPGFVTEWCQLLLAPFLNVWLDVDNKQPESVNPNSRHWTRQWTQTGPNDLKRCLMNKNKKEIKKMFKIFCRKVWQMINVLQPNTYLF